MVRKPNLRTANVRTSKTSGLYAELRAEKGRADAANHKLASIKALVAQSVWGHTALCLDYQDTVGSTQCICRALSHNLWLDRINDVLQGVQ